MGAIWNNSGLPDDEALAFLIAVDKAIADKLADGKAEARQAILERYGDDGTDRRAIKVNGEKVGTVSVSYSKPKISIKPGYEAEALDALASMGLTETVPVRGWESRLEIDGERVYVPATGELADWAMVTPAQAKNATVRGCEPSKVFPAMQAKLSQASALLLGEGR